jgi:hypothetical protein
MPVVLVAVLLMLTACDGVRAGFLNAGGTPLATARGIDRAYAARDACLARNAAERALAGATLQARAQSVALACAAQTEKLVAVSSRGDAGAAAAIRDDTEFRARGFVARAPALD